MAKYTSYRQIKAEGRRITTAIRVARTKIARSIRPVEIERAQATLAVLEREDAALFDARRKWRGAD